MFLWAGLSWRCWGPGGSHDLLFMASSGGAKPSVLWYPWPRMMKRRAPPSPSILVALGVAACTAPGLEGITSYDVPPDPPSMTTTTGSPPKEPAPTTSDGGSHGSTTEEGGSTSAGEGSSGPAAPAQPRIVEHSLGPNPLEHAGAVAASISTAEAEGVRIQVDDAAPIELGLAEPDAFVGEIALYSALENGDHSATFVAWRDALESAPLVVPFTVALPAAGSELFWDSDSAIGEGTVVALAVTPNNELIELGTFYPQGLPRCYLRRRDLGGTWFPNEFLNVMPDTPCSAIDLAVDAKGAIHVLADKFEDGEFRWWLGKTEAWAGPFAHVGTGAPGESALALASDPTRIAVCGTKPFGTDFDAAAWIFTPNKPGKVLSFDYVPVGKLPHTIVETPRDCAFSETHLVLAGAAWGSHDMDNTKRERHFVLEIGVVAGQPLWAVAGAESGSRSTAQALALDSQGRYITVGETCDDGCADPIGEIRIFLPGGSQVWQRALGLGISSPRDIAWSPAGYLVFVSAKDQGLNDSAFFAQAWFPLQGAPLWSYEHHDAPEIQAAAALAIGPFGQIYAGGVGAGGYPAIAIVAP